MTNIHKARKPFKHIPFILLFPLILLYYEVLFNISTTKSGFGWNLVIIIFFCFAYGGVLYVISSLFKKTKYNRIITAILLASTAIPYLVEYFVRKQFKCFYDLDTIFGGAGDAMTDFAEEAAALIFSFDGIFTIFLFFIPLILYLVFGKRFIPALSPGLIKRFTVLASVAVSYGIAIAIITMHPIYSLTYSSEYNFESAIPAFGLLNSIQLDIKNLTSDDVAFEKMNQEHKEQMDQEIKDALSESIDAPLEEAPYIEYGQNKLDIDFDALKLNASETHANLDSYVSNLVPSSKNQYTGLFKDKNLIMITAEAFSAQVIDPELTPTLYRLATKGINFNDYYQPASAGTTGGEYQVLFGMIPTSGGKSVKNTSDNLNYYTIGSMLDREGYWGKAFHNNSYTFYDRDETHNNLGYSEGFMGYGNGMEKYVSHAWPQSDLEMFEGTVPTYIDKDKFNVYYMTVSGHSNYGLSENSMTYKNWSRVKDLDCSNPIKGYLAANLELEDAMAYLVNALEEAGIADDTVICISTDHFPYGLDNDAALGNMPYLSELYGYNVTNYIERDKSALILWSGCLEDNEPIVVNDPVSGLDILPTLANLFGVEFDSRLLPGRDVFSDSMAIAFNSYYDWKTSLGTYISSTHTFTPVNDTVEIPEGYVDYIKSIVRNKIQYCEGALDSDYFRHVFG